MSIRIWLLSCWIITQSSFAQINNLPVYRPTTVKGDWLITPVTQKAGVFQTNGGKELVLSNGLISRRFRISPNLATVDFQNLSTNEQFVRSIQPEARVILNGKSYAVGGLYGQKEHAYLREEWLNGFTANAADFQFKSFTVSALTALHQLAVAHLDAEPETTYWSGIDVAVYFQPA